METELSAGHDSYTALLDDENLQKKLDRRGRHHTRFERTFHRSLKELKALQTNRAEREAVPPEERSERPPLAALKQISKRTHQPAEPAEPNDDEPLTDDEMAQIEAMQAQFDERIRNAVT